MFTFLCQRIPDFLAEAKHVISRLSPVRRFNHDHSPTTYRPISPLRTVLLSRVLLKLQGP